MVRLKRKLVEGRDFQEKDVTLCCAVSHKDAIIGNVDLILFMRAAQSPNLYRPSSP